FCNPGMKRRGQPALSAAGLLVEAIDCFLVNSFGLSLVAPASAGDFLVWLQVLVASEEVLDFILDVLLNVGDVLVALGTWVIDDAQQLIVSASFIGHLEDAEDAGFNDHTWEDGLWQPHQCI